VASTDIVLEGLSRGSTLIFIVVRVALVLGDELEARGRFAQEHFGDLEPVSAVRRCEQSFCDDRPSVKRDRGRISRLIRTHPIRFDRGKQEVAR